MSEKALDKKNRWRSKTVSFRVSPEEWEEIERLVRLSGMTKQDYIMHRIQNAEMTIQANPRVVKAMKQELNAVVNAIDTPNITKENIKSLREIISLVNL